MQELRKLIFNRRYRRIILLFIQFAFQFWWLSKVKRFMREEVVASKYRAMYHQQAVKFSDTAIEMGGLLIKLGQFFSSRVDILPQEYTDELARLQDAVKPEKTDIVIDRIENELGGKVDTVFAEFSREPLAAASLGQVHRARLIGGEEAAVKVLRPGIEDIVAIDLEALKLITTMGKRYRRVSNLVDLDEVYLEFKETVNDELDYIKEGKNAERFRDNFADDKRIYIPQIYWPHTTSKVLTMEYIEGLKITDYQALDEAGLDRKLLADTLWSSYLEQVLIDGFFHADPHPGNLLVLKDGTLVYLDFGMVGWVDQDMKKNILDITMAVYKKDAGAVVEGFERLGFLRPHADRSTLLKTIRFMLANLFGQAVDLKNMDLNELLAEIRELFYSEPFQIPARTTFLGKALGTNYGICVGLDEDFLFVEVSRPYVEQLIEGEGEFSKYGIIINEIKEILKQTITVPEKINRLVDGFESGDLRVNPSRNFERKLFEHQSHLANRITAAILSSGFLISGTQLLLGNFNLLGITFLVIGGLFFISLLKGKKTARVLNHNKSAAPAGFKRPKIHP